MRDKAPAAAAAGKIVVGVSPSTGSASALRWALDDADRRGLAVEAVMAWTVPTATAVPGVRPAAVVPRTAAEWQREAQEDLVEAVRHALGERSRDVTCRATRGRTAAVLLAAAEEAALVVVGPAHPRRAESLIARLRPAPMVLSAPCPVVIMPSREP